MTDPPQLGPGLWNIHLDSWIIQDGNYPDFVRGQTAEFAVEFRIPDGAEVSECNDAPVAKAVSDKYEVVGLCVVQKPELTVLDIGVRVYRQEGVGGTGRFFAAGSTFRTKIEPGVDPYFYFEHLNRIGGVEPLVYTWRIDSIMMQAAPFIEAKPRFFTRDPERLGILRSQRPTPGPTMTVRLPICSAANFFPFRPKPPALQLCRSYRGVINPPNLSVSPAATLGKRVE